MKKISALLIPLIFPLIAFATGSSNAINSPSLSNITAVNNAVVCSNGSGVGAWCTALPSGLTIPGFMLSSGTVVADDIATFTNTSGTAVKDSGIQLVSYGNPSSLNLFLSAGGAGNPSLGIAAHNIGIGFGTLLNLTTGVDNAVMGYLALVHDTTGAENSALGTNAAYANISGTANTAIGSNAWTTSTFGTGNTAIGYSALGNTDGGSFNTGVGYQAGANYTGTESNNILIGSLGVLGESNVMRLGTVGSGTGQVNTGYWGNVNIPLSTSVNTILYNSAANQVAQITPVSSAVVSTDGSGVPSESTVLPAGLTLPGATFTGALATTSNLQFTPLTVTTGTLTQSGTTVTFSSLPIISAYDGAFVVPATGNPYYVYYTGSSTTMQASRSQSVASPSAFTLYYFNNTGFISQPSTFAITQILFPNSQRVQIGSGASASLGVWNDLGSEAFGNGIAVGTGSTALTTTGNPTASQAGTTVTASTSVFTSDSVGRLIRFAEGSTATIRIVTNGTTVTVDKSQTISPGQQFFITGTGGTEAVSIGSSGDISAGNMYVHSSLNMLSHVISNVLDPVSAQDAATKNYVDTTFLKISNNLSDLGSVSTAQTNLNVPTRTGGNASGTWGINVSGNAATVTTNANLTGSVVTSVGNATSITNASITNAMLANSSATITAGNGLTNGGSVSLGSSVTLNVANSIINTWTTVSGTSQAIAAGNGYFANNASLVTFTLPAACTVGDVFRVDGEGAGGWKIAQNASQLIHAGSATTTTGTGGSLASTNQWDTAQFRCAVTNTTWVEENLIGNLTVV